jgi:flagellar assembly protein FliH
MKANAKYLFDEDFSSGGKPTITLVEADRRRAYAESQAYRQGFAAGENQAQADAAERTAAALGLIADGMERLERSLASIAARLETEAVEVAVAVAGKLAPELIARESFAEISALATESFNHLVKAPHVVVNAKGIMPCDS